MAEYISREDVLDNSNIITAQTKEYGSIEVIPVDTIADIELVDAQPVKWIKCSERMPSLGEGRIVMIETLLGVIDCKTVIPVRYVRTEVRGKSVERWEWLSGCVCHDNITHWMPLPEPPKDGETK